jgi:ABC-type multidrug transport system fused ATPase/permease subunit
MKQRRRFIRADGAIDLVIGHRRSAVGTVAGMSVLGGLCEALFLVAVTRIGFAVTDGAERVGIVAGWHVAIGPALALSLVLVAVRLALAAGTAWLAAGLVASSVAELRHRLAGAFLAASWELQQDERVGTLQELLATRGVQVSQLVMAVANGVQAAASLAALLAFAVIVEPLGAALLILSVGALGALLRPLRASVRRRGRSAAQANMEFATALTEVTQLGQELHVFHVQEPARRRLATLIERTRRRNRQLVFGNGLVGPVYTGAAYVALLGGLAAAASTSHASLKSLGPVMIIMLRSLTYGQALQSSLANIASLTAPVEDLSVALRRYEDARRHDGGVPIGSIRQVRADSVTFAYRKGPPVLRDVSFTVDHGEIVGIVGPSGSGKSSLVQLLLGLREPVTGRIFADGRDIGQFSRKEWARRVTFVPQTSHLVAGSISENIRFWRDDVTDADVQRAARLAHLHEDVLRFPDGYEHPVGEHGSHLSGGQQQRLCIARALVEHPDVLILDEPTSSLDVRSEHFIREALLELRARMTIIVIAHRLSTLDICDRIMVIQGGELKAFDEPKVLAESDAFFRDALTVSGLR